MTLDDLNEVLVELEHSKTETPKSSNATEEPLLRLRGGAGGDGKKYKLRDYEDDAQEDYYNALREAARRTVRARTQQEEKHVHFADAEEPHRYPSSSHNPRAGMSAKYGFRDGARTPTSAGQSPRGESHKPGGSNGLRFGQSSIGKNEGTQSAGLGFSRGVNFGGSSGGKTNGGMRGGIQGAGVKFSIVDSSGEEGSESGRPSHKKDKGDSHRGRRPRSPSPSPSPSPTRTWNHESRRDKSGKKPSKAAQEEHPRNSSDEEDREGRRPRSTSSSPRPTRTRNQGSSRAKSGKKTSKKAQEENSWDSEGSSDTENAIKDMPPDHYAVLGLNSGCTAQKYVDHSWLL